MRKLLRWSLAVASLAFAANARAVSFGPWPVIYPSTVQNRDLTIELTPSGTVSFEVAAQLFQLTAVSVDAGPLHFTLDPTLATPALGAIQADGSVLIPTLFLRGNDGANDFDLAIPNVAVQIFGAPETAIGLGTQFQIDSGSDVFYVALYVNAPEPGTALLLALGCGALALRTRKEVAR